MIELVPNRIEAGLGHMLNRAAVILAYAGGIVVSAIGVMSAVSIIGRSAISRPITGDFELVEIGTAIAGSLFLPYCQATYGHISVDIFTLRSSPRTIERLDRFGSLLMAIMFMTVGWRTVSGSIDLRYNGETSMLLGFPIWISYAAIAPGTFVAGIIALAQSFGIRAAERMADE
jgi:TRAP-type C4-dicarboxylate transport system permease small subunit